MSVLVKDRKESKMLFIDKSRELEEYTIEQCIKFPKKYTFSLANPLIDMARNICNLTIMANSTYPLNEGFKQKKLEYLSDALCIVKCFGTQLEIAMNRIQIFSGNEEEKGKEIKESIWKHWADLISDVLNLISKTKIAWEKNFFPNSI